MARHHYGGNISSNPWYISLNGSDMFLNATNIYLRCNASNENITLGDTGGYRIYLYLPTFCESTFSGTTGYFGNLLTSAGGISGTTSYNSGTGWFSGGLTGNAGYFTSLTGTNSYLSVITGNTGYFSNITGTNGYFTSLTGTTTYMASQVAGGVTASTGFFTTLTGTNSYVGIETGGTGYFTNMTGSNGFFTTLGCSGITGSVVAYTGDVQTATSNTKIVTPASLNNGYSNNPGYYLFPGGLILQFGNFNINTGTGNGYYIIFNVSYPSAIISINLTVMVSTNLGTWSPIVTSYSTTGFYMGWMGTGTSNTPTTISWMSMGF